jgi:predicted esterase
MRMILILWLGLLGSSAKAQRLHFGTNVVLPGTVIEFNAPLNARGRMEASQLRLGTTAARGAFVAPAALTNLLRPCPLFIVGVPSGGSAIGWMRSITNTTLTEGWAVLAADGPTVGANEDTIQFGWAMLSSVLDQFNRTWPQSKQWTVACGGFSGGAKCSAAVAAALTHDGWRVIGVFMGGCNEDFATLGLQLFQPGAHFKQTPFFLSNGTSDPIANPQHAATVAESMRRSGFRVLRLESHEGGHRQNNEHLTHALQWFQQAANLPSSGSTGKN